MRKCKPWLKATTEGALYIDTSHPEWKKWFADEIKRIQNSNGYKAILKQIHRQST